MIGNGASLCISLFGCPKVFHADPPALIELCKPCKALLAFLLLHGVHLHSREKLASTLWPVASPDSAAHSLRTTLWRLRSRLEPEGIEKGTYLLATPRGEVGFNWRSKFWADCLDFEAIVSRSNTASNSSLAEDMLKELEAALGLYEGELLEGFVDDWIIHERERFRQLYIQGLTRTMQSLTQTRRYDEALNYGLKILDLDPLRESVHRKVMRLCALTGQRGDALKQYDQLVQTLQTELDVAPMEETTSVYVEILRMEPKARKATVTHENQSELSATLQELQRCVDGLEKSHMHLRRVIGKLLCQVVPPSD